jgi:3-oxoadipate enol-lactonase
MTETISGYVDFNNARIYYEVEGDGAPATLLHAGVAHTRMWDEQVAAWRDRFRCIRYDQRGFGRTVTADVPYSNRDDLRAVLDHVGVQSTHLVGLSRGAMIALDVTVETPDRVRSLTWIAGGVRGFDFDDPRLVDVWPEMERLEAAREWESLVEMETQMWTDGPGQSRDRVDPEIRRRMVAWNMENYSADQQANHPVQPTVPAAELLKDIDVPLFAMWGTFDELGVLKSGEKLRAEVAGARSHVFEGVAHMVNLERPAEVNRLVADFIESVEASGPRTGENLG